jgi:hypothetical protein
VGSKAVIEPARFAFKPLRLPSKARLPPIIHPFLEFSRRAGPFRGASVRISRPPPLAKLPRELVPAPHGHFKAPLLPIKRPMACLARATVSFTGRVAHSNSLHAKIIGPHGPLERRAMSVSAAWPATSGPIASFERPTHRSKAARRTFEP